MKNRLLFILFLICAMLLRSQELTCSDVDKEVFTEKLVELKTIDTSDMGNTVIEVGKSFVGTPYVAQTLEINDEEGLIVNLREFDCTTYVENVLAFSMLLIKEEEDLNAFASVLQNIRYRDGEIQGYPSRLHYFTDWIANNQDKGLVTDVTDEIGGIALEKDIDFMSSHRESYPMLKDDMNVDRIRATEMVLSQKTLYYIPQDEIPNSEHLIKNGDIIALATSIKGLDVTHTGFAIRQKDSRIHLLHASSSGQVEITKKPLAEYLKAIKSNTGIIVARPQ